MFVIILILSSRENMRKIFEQSNAYRRYLKITIFAPIYALSNSNAEPIMSKCKFDISISCMSSSMFTFYLQRKMFAFHGTYRISVFIPFDEFCDSETFWVQCFVIR